MCWDLVKLIPPHKTYVEVFGGSGALLFAKDKSVVEVYNDINAGLANFFRVFQDPNQFEKLYQGILIQPYSRELYNTYKETWETHDDPVRKAIEWFYVARLSIVGIFGNSWRFSKKLNHAERHYRILGNVPSLQKRTTDVIIENTDWRNILQKYDSDDTFFYLDPPYVHSTRGQGRYNDEISEQDHKDLVEQLKEIKGKVLLSGYETEIYAPLNWEKDTHTLTCLGSATTRVSNQHGEGGMAHLTRTEVLWRNYDSQPRLF